MDQPLDDQAFDALMAEHLGPHLRVYVAARLAERPAPPPLEPVLEDLYAGLLACDAFVHLGASRDLFTRVYGLVERALPHLGAAALRRPVDPALLERARRFVALTAAHWHGLHVERLDGLLALRPREREAVLLREFHALTMFEIGQRLGLEREAARALVSRARELARPSG
ncbi:MAG: hypothetical protein M9894_15355 [Planctomycetes bacterium]|nr:hypothetical protein [Planctomycetota bacterium]